LNIITWSLFFIFFFKHFLQDKSVGVRTSLEQDLWKIYRHGWMVRILVDFTTIN